MVKQTEDGWFFAKNSDRDPNEAQIVEWHRGQIFAEDATVQATFIEIPQVTKTYSTIISRPWWMFGAEMGTNEHSVTIGNEAVFTNVGFPEEDSLLGMDMLRFALERSTHAEEAVETIVQLLERYGQSGSCSYEHPDFVYHNSFLIADKNDAYVLETAGKQYAVEKVRAKSRSISNQLTIPDFAEHFHSHRKSFLGTPELRQAVTQEGMKKAQNLFDVMKLLAYHGPDDYPTYSPINGSMVGPNMHAGGLLAHSQTVSSWVSDLSSDTAKHYATGSADPALSIFLPLTWEEPLDFGAPTNQLDLSTWWWFSETLHRLTVRNYAQSIEIIKPKIHALQEEILTGMAPKEAYSKAYSLKSELIELLREKDFPDTRPYWLKRSWRKENQKARGLVNA